jgi:hypothetical protein
VLAPVFFALCGFIVFFVLFGLGLVSAILLAVIFYGRTSAEIDAEPSRARAGDGPGVGRAGRRGHVPVRSAAV